MSRPGSAGSGQHPASAGLCNARCQRWSKQGRPDLEDFSAAEANGRARVAEMNKQVAGNPGKIIASLEDGGQQKETAAGAS